VAQNYQFQEGFSLGGGISSTGQYSGFLEKQAEPGTSQYQAFSWEGSVLRIRKINEGISFSHGIGLLMYGHRFERNRELWKSGSDDSVQFASNRQRFENYCITFPFRWSFFLNKNPGGRFFIGPGIALTLPVYQVLSIKGKDAEGKYHDITERKFPEKGPYAYLCPEIETGWLFEFPDCSLARFSLFFQVRTPGILKDDSGYSIQSYSGFRFGWFFGNN
jgi:hypothetical protein